MAVEIERKFLVVNDSYRQTAQRFRITQGYISTDPDRIVRVRTYGNQAFLTIKNRKKGISRSEFEFEIDVESALEILENICYKPLIDKLRYLVEYKGYTWEVDEFLQENEGLVVAEIELPSEDTHFEIPDWVGEEVTHDFRYTNSNLVKHPFCQW